MKNVLNLFVEKYMLYLITLFCFLALVPYVSFFPILRVENSFGIIYRGIVFCIISIVFAILIFSKKNKLPLVFYILVLIYFVSQIITIVLTPRINNVTIETKYSIIGLVQTLSICLSVLSYIIIAKNIVFDKKAVNITCLIFTFFGFIICVYSYVFQWEEIYHTFNTMYGWNYDVTSIFTTKTEYGFVLYVCALFSLFFTISNRKYLFSLFSLFFLVNMFISRSKTSIFCTAIVFAVFLVLFIAKKWEKYHRTIIVVLSICMTLMITIIVLTILKIGWFSNFNYYVTKVLIGDGYVVMEDRINKWSKLILSINTPFSIIFGYGERITPFVLSTCKCATIGDNIYLSNYGVGGVIKFALYICVVIYVIKMIWKQNINLSTKIICLSIQLSFIIAGMFEDDSIVGMAMSGLFASIIFYSCNKMIKEDFC